MPMPYDKELQAALEAAGFHKELLAKNRLYRHLHYIEFNEMAEVV